MPIINNYQNFVNENHSKTWKNYYFTKKRFCLLIRPNCLFLFRIYTIFPNMIHEIRRKSISI
jgi:hypothetical protein